MLFSGFIHQKKVNKNFVLLVKPYSNVNKLQGIKVHESVKSFFWLVSYTVNIAS